MVADPRFRRWATRFPLTRPVARRRTRALFDVCAGFVYSQILYTCVRLNLFDILAEQPQGKAALAGRLHLPLAATERLLDAAVSLGLADRRGGQRYGLGPLGAAMVGNRGIAEMVLHHAMLYRDLENPLALLRGEQTATELGHFWAYAGQGAAPQAAPQADRIRAYTALMAASQPLVADEVLDAYPLHRHQCLLDLGAGDGSFLAAAAARAPNLRVIAVDLPPVAAMAQARFERTGLSDRARAVGADFLTDKLPQGADIVSLVRVLHDHDDSQALAILRAARSALPRHGTLLVAEPMARTRGAEPIGDAYFGFYLLAMGQGRPRTPAALMRLLTEAGFGRARLLPTRTPLLIQAIVARPL